MKKRIYRYDIIQNTPEWTEIKVGMFSASTADALLSEKSSSGYKKLIAKIAEERITGKPCESKMWQGNQFTERGHLLEPVAANDYELRHLITMQQVGVVIMNDWVLCSPDRLIGKDGLWQGKCPIFSTQKEYLDTKKVPGNYYKQIQFELYATGRKYDVFNSFHPSLAPVEIKLQRDETMIAMIDKRIKEAIEEVKIEIDRTINLK